MLTSSQSDPSASFDLHITWITHNKGATREYRPYRVVTTSRLKARRQLVVHDNLKTFNLKTLTKYSERSVQNLHGLASVKFTLRPRTL